MNRVVFETPWFSVEELGVPGDGTGAALPFYRINASDGVICLPMTEGGDFVMVRQFRHALQRTTLEFPAGAIDAGETPEVAARREVIEETGFACDSFVFLGPGGLHLNRYRNTEHFFLGLGARRDPDWSAEPGVEPVVVPRSQLRALIAADRFEQIAALGAFVMAEVKLGCRLLDDPPARIVASAMGPDPLAQIG